MRRIAALYDIPIPGPSLITEKALRRTDVRVSTDAPTEVMHSPDNETMIEE